MDWRDKLSNIKAKLPQEEEQKTEAIHKAPISTERKEQIRIELDKRNGKPSTLITEFLCNELELRELAKMLKIKCGSGGSCRDGEILIQGDFRIKISEILSNMGYRIKKINFK